jgi:hypothetical protein
MALNEPVRLADKGVQVSGPGRLAWMPTPGARRWPVSPERHVGRGRRRPARLLTTRHFPLSSVALRAGELRMLGQRLTEVSLRAVMDDGGWQAKV